MIKEDVNKIAKEALTCRFRGAQARNFVDLAAEVSWQTQHFADLEAQLSWQAQLFGDLGAQLS